MVTVRVNVEQLQTVGLIAWYLGWMPLITWAVLVWMFHLGVSWPGVEVTYMLLYSLVFTYVLLRWQAGRSAETAPETEGVPPQKETVAQSLHRADTQLQMLGSGRR